MRSLWDFEFWIERLVEAKFAIALRDDEGLPFVH